MASPAKSIAAGLSESGPTTIPPTMPSRTSAATTMRITRTAATAAFFNTMSRSHSRYFRMATPAASGIPSPIVRKNRKKEMSFSGLLSLGPRPIPVTKRATKRNAAIATAKATHRICCRSSPRARRNRTRSAAAEASEAPIAPSAATVSTGPRKRWRPSIASGFGMVVPPASSVRLLTPSATSASPKNPHTAQATGRHRGEGSVPVGKRRNSRGIGTTAKKMEVSATSAAARPNGSEPGDVSNVYVAYSDANPLSRNAMPASMKSHPTGFRGNRDATTAPTVAYPVRTTTAIGMNGTSSEKLPFRTVMTIVATSSASVAPHRIQGARERSPRLIAPPPPPVPCPSPWSPTRPACGPRSRHRSLPAGRPCPAAPCRSPSQQGRIPRRRPPPRT